MISIERQKMAAEAEAFINEQMARQARSEDPTAGQCLGAINLGYRLGLWGEERHGLLVQQIMRVVIARRNMLKRNKGRA